MENIVRFGAIRKLTAIPGMMVIMVMISLQALGQTALFNANITTGCEPLTVNFNNLSTNATSYYWIFGNGNTSTLPNPTTVYTNPGTYTVKLIAINGSSRDTLTKVDYIFVPPSPVPDFTVNTTTGCQTGNTFSFTNLTVNGATYSWDFGDGNSSNQQNPTHTYSAAGVYTVKLIATNNHGCTRVKTRVAYITINPDPVASFTVNNTAACDSTQVFQFASAAIGAVNHQWIFSNGTTSGQINPAISFNAYGSYDVTLIVTSTNGCTDTVIQQSLIDIIPAAPPVISVNTPSGCAPFQTSFTSNATGVASWLWTFGDGSTSSQQSPSHTYLNTGAYDVGLTIVNAAGCTTSVNMPSFISVNPSPVPSFTYANTVGCSPVTVNFTNTTVGANSYSWTLGNGGSTGLVSPNATYITTGNYNVVLTATSANGCSATASQSISVTANDITAFFTGNPTTGCAPLPVNFTGSSSPLATSWDWSFGDGTTSTLRNPSHTYSSTGNYNVRLVVTSSAGCKDTLIKNAYIKVVTDTAAYVVPDTMIVCLPPGVIGFTAPNQANNWWSWDFGDGSSSSVRSPIHTYTSAGVYTVSLQTAMAGGCSRNYNPFAIVKVVEADTFPILAITTTPCGPYTVSLATGSPIVGSFVWDFGDGTTSTLAQPTHTYSQPGTYVISLDVTGVDGCESGMTAVVTFGHPNPITISDNDACTGDSLQFGLSPVSQFISAVWDFGDGNTSTNLQPRHVYASAGFYPVSVSVVDINGCSYEFDYPTLIAIGDPQPAFTFDTSFACIPFNVQFTNNSTGASTYSWDFGAAGTSNQENPSVAFTAAGVYDVTLTATMNGCTRSVTQTNAITANQAQAFFNFNPVTGCLPMTVTFNDNSVNPVSWFWEFGDGNTSTVQNPVHIFTTVPTTNVKLTITDINGCTKTRSKPNIEPVIPVIQFNDSLGCRPLMVNFSTPTNAASYFWDFGDGYTSTLQNPNHLFVNEGNFTVTLTCTLSSGCTTTTVIPNLIDVNAPESEFMSPTSAACAPSVVQFVNQSVGAVSWKWDFGDGTTSTNENPSHIYHLPGVYTVTLISFSAEGCSDTLVKVDYVTIPGTYSEFTMANTVNCFNTAVQFVDLSIGATSWFWNFGDGYTSIAQNPTHLYQDSGSYTVTLITSNSTGCNSFYTLPNPITIYPLPQAQATVSSIEGCHPVNVTFTNSSVNANTYHWDFGNGDTSNSITPSYTYANPGTYQIQLIAYTSMGCSDTLMLPNPVVVNPTPSAQFSTSGSVGCNPFPVAFSNQSSLLSTPSYNWFFGNGSASNSSSPSTIYSDSGSYAVTLIVTNLEGCSDSTTATIDVNITPTALGTASNWIGCHPTAITFMNNSLNADSYVWSFGNGDMSSMATPNYSYSVPGTYQVQLVAITNMGCTDTFDLGMPIVVNPTPSAQFTTSGIIGCNPFPVTFTNQSGILSTPTYSWVFGNGSGSSMASPTTTYADSGSYVVSLVVTNQEGCSDTTTANIDVNLTPIANATVSAWTGCSPTNIAFSNLSANADSLIWYFGDGSFSNDANPQHTYVAGNYDAYLIALTDAGCRDTFHLPAPVQIHPVPTASFSSTQNTGCPGTSFALINQSTPATGLVFNWVVAGTPFSIPNPSIILNNPGFYDASLVVTNQFGCSDSVYNVSYIEVFDTLPPPASPILSVSVVDDQSVEITWQNTSVSDFGAYRIYRRNNDTGLFSQVYSTTTNPIIGPGSVSSYVDNGLNTLENTYTYKVQTEDRCAYILPLTALVAHTTVNIKATSYSNNIHVEWTPYGGCQVATYELERLDLNSGIIEHVASLPGTVTTFDDLDFPCPTPYSYRVRATDLCGNSYYSWSDTSAATPANILASQKVDVVRSTVIDDADVMTEWAAPVLRPDRVKEYRVLRSEGNANFVEVARVPAGTHMYLDVDAEVHQTEYYYRIEIITDCELAGEMSNQSSSIFLQSDYDYNNLKSKLWWTPYNAWDSGVDYYVIEKLNAAGAWDVIRTVDGGTLETTFDE